LWEQDRLGVKPSRSWNDAVVKWLEETRHKATHADDVARLRWLDKYLRGQPLDRISRDVIGQIGEVKARESSGPTANRTLALIRAILRRACHEWEWIDKAPKVRMFKEWKRRVRWITRVEAERLLSFLPAHQADMARFALSTGLRQANVTGLEWSQLDMQRRVAWIHPDQAKARKAIPVPLNDEAVDVIRRQLGKHSARVFTFKGKPVRAVNTKAWKRALRLAGIEDFRWHDLRHTWASWHVQAGTSIQELQELGGWESVEMVRRYAHPAPEHLAKAAARIIPIGTKMATAEERKRARAS
jgi:integrase